jgi:hypothetical protein
MAKGKPTPILTDARVGLALHMTWETDALLNAVIDSVDRTCFTEDQFQHANLVRCLCVRMIDLNNAMMSTLDDELETDESIHGRVFGRKLDRTDAARDVRFQEFMSRIVKG